MQTYQSIFLSHILFQETGTYVSHDLDLSPSRCAFKKYALIDEDWSVLVPEFLTNYATKKLTDDFIFDFLRTVQIQISFLKLSHYGYLSILDRAYPALLRKVHNPPLGLFYRGSLSMMAMNKATVLGSRKSSANALRQSQSIGYRLAMLNYCVVSGGAWGCDIFAHRGALQSGMVPCPAIAVLPSGLDDLTPKCNGQTFMNLLNSGGLLVSEKPFASSVRKYDYLIRNRILVGLSPITIIVQANTSSGACTSAHLCREERRELLVWDDQTEDVRSMGNRRLIQGGASRFRCVDQALEHLGCQ